MSKLIQKNKIILAIIAYILFLTAIFYFAVRPLLKQISSENTKIQQELVNQEARKKRLGELPKLKGQHEMVINNEKDLVSLVTENMAVELIEKIEKIAETTGNKLTIEIYSSKDKKAATPKKGAKKEEEAAKSLITSLPSSEYLEVKASLSGSYNNLLKFLNKIENLEYYCDVISVEISVDPNQGKDKNVVPKENNKEEGPAKNEIAVVETPQDTLINSIIYIAFYLNK